MAAKKEFRSMFQEMNEHPTSAFISAEAEPQAPAGETMNEKADWKAVAQQKSMAEKRSKKVLLLMKPSLYDKLHQSAKQLNRSVNDLINIILEEAMK